MILNIEEISDNYYVFKLAYMHILDLIWEIDQFINVLDVSGMNIKRFNLSAFYWYCNTLRSFLISGTRFEAIHD